MSKHPLYNTTGLQKNNKSHIMYALANKQMELKQLEDEYEAKISKIKSDLTALETTICLFDENCSETINRLDQKVKNSKTKTRNIFFKSGEAMKLVLQTLRLSNNPLSFQEIFQKIWDIKSKEIDISQKDKFEKSLSVTLNSIYKKELINKVMIRNKALWSINQSYSEMEELAQFL